MNANIYTSLIPVDLSGNHGWSTCSPSSQIKQNIKDNHCKELFQGEVLEDSLTIEIARQYVKVI